MTKQNRIKKVVSSSKKNQNNAIIEVIIHILFAYFYFKKCGKLFHNHDLTAKQVTDEGRQLRIGYRIQHWSEVTRNYSD